MLSFICRFDIAQHIRIKSLRVEICPDGAGLLGTLFKGIQSTIEALDIKLIHSEGWDGDVAAQMLSSVGSLSGRLKRLEAHAYPDDESELSHINRRAIYQGYLNAIKTHTLTLTHVKLSAVKSGYRLSHAISKLPSLEVLESTVRSGPPFQPYVLEDDPGFPSLRELTLRSDSSHHDEPFHLELLQGVTSTTLRQLSFATRFPVDAYAVMHLVSTKWPTTFEELHVEIHEEADTDAMNVFSPLLVMPQLQRLILVSQEGLSLTDTDIGRLASAWPNVVQLMIGPAYMVQEEVLRPSASLHALCSIVTGLPKLTELTISIDFDITGDWRPTVSSQTLTHLHLAISYTSNHEQTISIILAMFPQLKSVAFGVPGMNGITSKVLETIHPVLP